ncbi:NAD(P)/FAD-dependent oxidoreductase, partial [Streptomyces sp. TOR3209]
MQEDQRVFDVAIVGGGIGGTMLGTVLARHGVRVLLLEGSGHPRFAIGESTVPETTFGLRVLARRYDVPELEHLATNAALRRHVSSNCGVKRNFSFVHHREGEPTRPDECTQYPTWGPPLGPDSHYFRQDVDAYLFHVAVSYGVTAYTHTMVDDVKFEEDGATLVTRDRGSFRASYVVDAGGMRA